jgi:hypothetical protein
MTVRHGFVALTVGILALSQSAVWGQGPVIVPVDSWNRVLVSVEGSFPTDGNILRDTGQLPPNQGAVDIATAKDNGFDLPYSWAARALGYANSTFLGASSSSDVLCKVDCDIVGGGAASSASVIAIHHDTVFVYSDTLPIGTAVDLALTVTVSVASLINAGGNALGIARAWSQTFGGPDGLINIRCGPPDITGFEECTNYKRTEVIHTRVGDSWPLEASIQTDAESSLQGGTPFSGTLSEADGFHSLSWTLDPVTPGSNYSAAGGETWRSTGATDANPTATAFSFPTQALAGDDVLLIATIHLPPTFTSTGIVATADLSQIGEATDQSLFDDGTHGDHTAGDLIFALSTTVAAATSAGEKRLPVTISDAQGRHSETFISIFVQNNNADVLPPITHWSAFPPPNARGWNNTPVTVTLSAADNVGGTGVQQIDYQLTGAQTQSAIVNGDQVPVVITTEGTTTLTFFAIDRATNHESRQEITVRVDTAPPMLTFASPTPAPNVAEWHNTDVTLGFMTNDTLSGVASTSPMSPLRFSAEGIGVRQDVAVTDNAGNSAMFTSAPLNIDKTSPVVTYSGNAGQYTADQKVNIGCTAVDPLGKNGTTGSGVVSSTCLAISGPAYTFRVGINEFSSSATDRAGNVGIGSTAFTVTVTPAGVCALTTQFISGSDRFVTLPPRIQAQALEIASTLCEQIAHIPTLAPAQKKAVLIAYQKAIASLVRQGWITQAEATTLINLSSAL